ncbi:MAG TPA: HDOD domain-containing protein, partial [Rhodocyclaceae bacterium]|nr:HDOD domain-containing protein [Rhodocyclaceae bacterium]
MTITSTATKTYSIEDAKKQCAAFSAAIEHELATGEFVFPTSMQAAVKVRRALDEPDVSMVSVARIIGLEPLLSVKLLRMANS